MTRGVVLMSYGTPRDPAAVEAYYTHVRRGRPPTAEQLADLVRRYDAIGGMSPLAERTAAQGTALGAALGDGWTVAVGAKHAAPFIEDAVAGLAAVGVTQAVGLVLAPHYSVLSVGEYAERAAAAGDEHAIDVAVVDSWHLEPGLVTLLAERVRAAGAADLTLFTAHSLPERVLALGDPYPEQLRQTAEAVAAEAGLDPGAWRLAWQSAGRTPEPWLGPDLLTVLRAAAGDGARSVLVCPAGFTSDHLEVLYDVDVEAAALAAGLGMELRRTASLNDDPGLADALAGVVRRRADQAWPA